MLISIWNLAHERVQPRNKPSVNDMVVTTSFLEYFLDVTVFCEEKTPITSGFHS